MLRWEGSRLKTCSCFSSGSRVDQCFVGRDLRYKNYIRLRLCNARPILRSILAKPLFSEFYHQKRYPKGRALSGKGNDIDLLHRLYRWGGVVQETSVRLFTVHADTLAAVSGLASAFQTPELGRYFAGVWECNPFVSMTWHVRYSQSQPDTYRARYV
jgi:hypothetical protein